MRWQRPAPRVQLTSPPILTEAATGQVLGRDDEKGEGLMGSQRLGGGSLEGSWMRPLPAACMCVGWGSGDAWG